MAVRPIIAPSAYRHDVRAEDRLHAYNNAFRAFDMDEDFVMHVGADRAGNLLEVGTVRSNDGSDVIVHAMSARSKFLR